MTLISVHLSRNKPPQPEVLPNQRFVCSASQSHLQKTGVALFSPKKCEENSGIFLRPSFKTSQWQVLKYSEGASPHECPEAGWRYAESHPQKKTESLKFQAGLNQMIPCLKSTASLPLQIGGKGRRSFPFGAKGLKSSMFQSRGGEGGES